MIDIKKQFARFVRDVTEQPESSIALGRDNVLNIDMSALLIVIEELENPKLVSRSERYNGDSEIMYYDHQYVQEMTVDFFGDNAYQIGSEFELMINSQKGLEAARDLDINPKLSLGLIDLKQLSGEQYSERHQLTCKIYFTKQLEVSTLRIDTAQTSIIQED